LRLHDIPADYLHARLEVFAIMANYVHDTLFIVDASVGAKDIPPLPMG